LNPSGSKDSCYAFSPDGKAVAIGFDSGFMCIWDVMTRRPRGDPLKLQRRGINRLVFSPDSKLVIAFYDYTYDTLQILDALKGKPIGKAYNDFTMHVSFSSDGSSLACIAKDGAVWVWNVNGFAEGRRLEGSVNARLAAKADFSFLQDNTTLRYAPSNPNIEAYEWDASTGIQKVVSRANLLPSPHLPHPTTAEAGIDLKSLKFFCTSSARGEESSETPAHSTFTIRHNSLGYNSWYGLNWPCRNQFQIQSQWIIDSDGKRCCWLPFGGIIHDDIWVYGGRRLVLIAQGLHILDLY
jgi:WD40 repeat protein